MSTDRELLEKAAKAAGLDFRWEAGFPGEMEEPTVFDEEGFGDYWNPLVEDGDALRLSVSLEIAVDYFLIDVYARNDMSEPVTELYGEDRFAATRRAIVRAAAAMGEKA